MKKKADIQCHYTIDPFDLNTRKLIQWIEGIIAQHKKSAGGINIIFCDDEYLQKLNKKFLQHDYYTDIISFPLGTEYIEGELYISIDRVKENAKNLKIDFEWEILRVIIHGILHFLGYSDKTKAEIKKIRSAEDNALKYYQEEFLKDDHYFDRVYDVVRCIPKGRVCSYGIIADYLSLGSARMVGWALNKLEGHVSDIPAHRVVNVKGELSGRIKFGEAGERMGKLLIKEGVKVKNYKVQNLELYLWKPGD